MLQMPNGVSPLHSPHRPNEGDESQRTLFSGIFWSFARIVTWLLLSGRSIRDVMGILLVFADAKQALVFGVLHFDCSDLEDIMIRLVGSETSIQFGDVYCYGM